MLSVSQNRLRASAMWHGSNKNAEAAVVKRREGVYVLRLELQIEYGCTCLIFDLGISVSPPPRPCSIADEMRQINDAVKTQRRARLRDLYILEQIQFEKELAAKGLAIIRIHE